MKNLGIQKEIRPMIGIFYREESLPPEEGTGKRYGYEQLMRHPVKTEICVLRS